MEKSGELKDKETPEMKKRLIASLCFLIPLMYLSMGHMMWGWKVPEILLSGHEAKIKEWELQQSLERTRRLRPDLLGEE